MKRMHFLALTFFVATGIAAAQKSDVLGPHINAGHGCKACHTPHSRATTRGHGSVFEGNSGSAMLWGEDVHNPHASVATAPAQPGRPVPPSPEHEGMLICLSCHDGNYAPEAMMKNKIYESIPPEYGAVDDVPTMVDKLSVSTGYDMKDHPLGMSTQMGCGGKAGWDCAESQGAIAMAGPRSARFAANYGFFVQPKRYENASVVLCTTCHNPHSETTIGVSAKSASALFPAGTYSTRYFLRAPYDPTAYGAGSNQAAQFCRQCHADKSNEMNSSSTGSQL